MSTFNPFGKFFGGTVPLKATTEPVERVSTVAEIGVTGETLAATATTGDTLASRAGVSALSATNLGAATLSATAINRTATFVDVGDKPVSPTIVRGGEEVVAPPLNPGKIDDLITRLVPIRRVQVPRSVSQSIAPGTMVAKGTPVDLVFVPVSDIDFSLFDNVHDDLKFKTVESVLPLLKDTLVAPILQKNRIEDLTDNEKQILTDKLQTIEIGVDETTPNRSIGIAFNSLKNAKAFQ
jgi:hypothetical protein